MLATIPEAETMNQAVSDARRVMEVEWLNKAALLMTK
jgi:hypothetical protein